MKEPGSNFMLRRFAKYCLPIVLLAAVGATAVPAAAATPQTGVTVFLKSHHLAELRQLGSTHGLTHAERVRAVQRLLPTPAQHSKVIKSLRAAGLTITHETAWSVSASGSSTAVNDTFGTHAPMQAHATPAQRRAATGPYPSLPDSMGDAAVGAYPTDSGPAMFHPHAPDFLVGEDFRNAYTSPDLTAHGQAPYSGANPKATLTIATIQFAGWNPDDLAEWAATDGIGVPGYDPDEDLTMVPVDQASVPTPTTEDDGDTEVDLDQEAILSTNPFAHQRPYFPPNTASGFYNALSQVLDDVLQDNHAYKGGDPHIVALSSSWGLCEQDTGAAQINAVEPVLASLLAAGVTMFASSGDDGIYDQCSTSGAHVDYPASSPEFIGVGGTTLSPIGTSTPNNGSNWTETAWSCVSAADCDSNGGGGGGVSGDQVNTGFSKPEYQSLLAAPYAQVTRRMVPDIAANADPDTGFPIFTSDPSGEPGYYQTGGTSLAAPVSAALFTNALSAHAVKFGVVDVLPALYTAGAANDGSFRDITSGSNGAQSDAGPINPSVSAGAGYDTVTGLGAPLWPKIVDRVLDPLAWPTATAKLALAHPTGASSPNQITASWTGTPASGGLDVTNSAVRIVRLGHRGSIFSKFNAPASGSHSFTGKPGSTYELLVTTRDVAGTTSITKVRKLVVPFDDKALSFFGSWQHNRGNGDYAGTLSQTSHRNAAASVKASGKSYGVLVHTGPSYGKLVVSQNGHKIKTINLHAGHSGTKVVTFFTAKSVSNRRFDFFCVGKLINIDAVLVGR